MLGAGAGGYATAHLRYETQTLEVRHAHGFLVQTLADLGLVGLVLALALLLAWMAAAGADASVQPPLDELAAWLQIRSGARPAGGPARARAARYTPERIGMLSMLCLVVVFGAHSLVDWTWYVPGDACVALLCAGWLAGRGELVPSAERGVVERRAADADRRRSRGRTAEAATELRAFVHRRRRDRGCAAGDVVAVAAAALRRSRPAG